MSVRSLQVEADASVLCWFATVSADGVPNVSPKEVFALLDAQTLAVADIASPTTVRNLRANPQACVAFVDVFRQTGYKLVGRADALPPDHPSFAALAAPLFEIVAGRHRIRHVLRLTIDRKLPIVAPSFRSQPAVDLKDRIADTLRTYGVRFAEDAARAPDVAPAATGPHGAQTPLATPRLDHIAVWTHDLDRSIGFWTAYFEAEVGPEYRSENRPGFASRFVTLPPSGLRIEIMTGPWVGPAPDEAAGWAHAALTLGSRAAVDAAARRFQRDGLLRSAPRTTGDGYYEAVVAAPDGTILELVA